MAEGYGHARGGSTGRLQAELALALVRTTVVPARAGQPVELRVAVDEPDVTASESAAA